MTTIKPGDCFYNVRRFSCLRVKRVYQAHVQGVGCPPEGHKVWYADAITWRPDGTKGSNLVKVRLDSLTKLPYWRMEAVRVYAGGQAFEFELGEKRELHNGTTYCTSISSTDWSAGA